MEGTQTRILLCGIIIPDRLDAYVLDFFFPGGCLELNFWLMFNITCSPKYKMQYVKRAMIMVFFLCVLYTTS